MCRKRRRIAYLCNEPKNGALRIASSSKLPDTNSKKGGFTHGVPPQNDHPPQRASLMTRSLLKKVKWTAGSKLQEKTAMFVIRIMDSNLSFRALSHTSNISQIEEERPGAWKPHSLCRGVTGGIFADQIAVKIIEHGIAAAGGGLHAFSVEKLDLSTGAFDQTKVLQSGCGKRNTLTPDAENIRDLLMRYLEASCLLIIVTHQQPSAELLFDAVQAVADGGKGQLIYQ